MRRATLLIFAASFLCAQDPSPTGSIHGVVKDDATGLPLPGARVQTALLFSIFNDFTTVVGVGDGPVTDDQGRYSITGLRPGNLKVIASHPKRISATRTVQLTAGEDLAVDFLLFAPPSISGRVLDENKKPVRGAYVWLIRSEYRSGALRLTRIGPRNTSDDGSFLFEEIEAGRAYYLLAEHPTAGSEKRVAAPTYYGEATSLDAAAPLTLHPGERREQADITMRMAATYCVDGEVRAGGKPASPSVTIQQAALAGTGPTMAPTYETNEEGSFQACGLTPGEYVVSALRDNLTARELFTIADADVHHVHLTLDSAAIRWELVWDGDSTAEPKEAPPAGEGPAPLSVSLGDATRVNVGLPSDLEIAGILSRTDSDTQVRVTKPAPYSDRVAAPVSAGDYTVEAYVASGAYIKEIAYGGVAVIDGRLHLTPGSSGTLRVLACRGGSTIATKVTDPDDRPVPDATVIVVPEQVSNSQQFSAFARHGTTDTVGSFTSPTLAPGKYRVLALTRSYRQTPEDIERILLVLSNAQTVELSPRANVHVSLRPIDF